MIDCFQHLLSRRVLKALSINKENKKWPYLKEDIPDHAPGKDALMIH
jgi:hypothetical protein